MSTTNTTERGLIRTVARVHIAAEVARLRCVPWIDQHNRHTAHLRFVPDVGPKLEERPIAVFGACGFPNRFLGALANVGQIFQCKRTPSAFGFPHKLLCNRVVGIRLKAALFAAEGLQAPFGRLCTNGLQAITTALVLLSYTFNLFTAVLFAVAVGRKIDDTKIDSQRLIDIVGRWFVNVARHKEVELTFTQDQIAFTLSRLQQLVLAFATHKGYVFQSPIHRPDRNRLLVEVERQDAIIVGDTAVRSVRALHLPIQLVAVTDFRKAADHHLCRQAVISLDLLVHQLLQIVLPKDLLFPRHATDCVARGVRRFQRALQRISLFGHRLQLDLGDDFHILNYSTKVRRRQLWAEAAKAARFLPRLKPVGFRA